MIEKGFHTINAAQERLYIPRDLNGRGVNSVCDHVERCSYNFSEYLGKQDTVRKRVIKNGLEHHQK